MSYVMTVSLARALLVLQPRRVKDVDRFYDFMGLCQEYVCREPLLTVFGGCFDRMITPRVSLQLFQVSSVTTTDIHVVHVPASCVRSLSLRCCPHLRQSADGAPAGRRVAKGWHGDHEARARPPLQQYVCPRYKMRFSRGF